MAKEKWSAGKCGGTVISDTPNHFHSPDSYEYYGGHLVAESIPQQYVNLIAAAPSMLALLEKALPIIEEEAERRSMAMNGDADRIYQSGEYWIEMRDLANEIQAEIDKAYGRETSKPDPELCPHGYGFVEYCEDCKKGKEVEHGK